MTYDINKHPYIKDILAIILTAIIGALLIFGCNSCSTSKTVEKTYTEVSTDSTYHNSTDSVYVSSNTNSTDSVVTNTVVYVTLDSLGNETKRIEYHDTYRSKVREQDNTKVSVKTDTIYKTKYKMVNSTLYRYVVREATYSIFQRAMMLTGKIAIALLLLGLIIFIIKKRGLLQSLFKL